MLFTTKELIDGFNLIELAIAPIKMYSIILEENIKIVDDLYISHDRNIIIIILCLCILYLIMYEYVYPDIYFVCVFFNFLNVFLYDT